MKTDRFVKVMLVIIAGLLFLNCVKDVPFTSSNSPTTSRNDSTQSPNSTKTSTIPFIESSVEAAPAPAFIQVEKSYTCRGYVSFKVKTIDKNNSGWIETYDNEWRNTSLYDGCKEDTPQTK